ncbi:hypothetical protein, partial [Streptomyces sp. NPDC047009]|uniref:hypothetical protein n=1 Tax=Streptomyces sp. NPDC047009 TaxID=3154496 RepID=UPI0033E63128
MARSLRDLIPAPRDVSAGFRASSAVSPIPSRARQPRPARAAGATTSPRPSSGRRPVDAGGFRDSLRARHGSRRDLIPAPRDVSAASRASSAVSPPASRARQPRPA